MQRDRSRTWLLIAGLTFLTALVWVGVSAVAAFRKSTVTPQVESLITPLDPNLDSGVLTDLSRRAGGKGG